jgi:hypothetical protein
MLKNPLIDRQINRQINKGNITGSEVVAGASYPHVVVSGKDTAIEQRKGKLYAKTKISSAVPA